MSCDQCQAYHLFGYDRCPACQPPSATPTPPLSPAGLLRDVEEQMRQRLLEAHGTSMTMPTYALAVWMALLGRARELVRESE